MYPRNAASPPRIAVGAVVQISDGAVQSSGVSIAVRAEGGAESAGGGTTTYGGSSNIVYYAPTQAETDYTAFVVTAYKTGCIPVSVTVVTTLSAVSGQVVAADTQKVDLNTIKTQAVTCSGGVTVPAATLASTTNITAGTITTTTNLTNLPAIPTDWITAAGIQADAIDASALATDAITEIVNAILAGEMTELASVPGASPTLKQAIALLYMALRNKRDTTSSADTIANDAGTTIATAALSDNGTTFTKAEYA